MNQYDIPINLVEWRDEARVSCGLIKSLITLRKLRKTNTTYVHAFTFHLDHL